jgi:predicted P-loop ATPase
LELEDVIGALLAFHQRKKNIDENFQGEELVVNSNYERGRSSNKGDSKCKNSWSKSKRRKDINCYKCGKKGHIKRDCSDRKKNKDDENEGSSKSANIVENNSDDADGDMLFVASNSEHPVDS